LDIQEHKDLEEVKEELGQQDLKVIQELKEM
jgi:hypothetical protein